MGKMTHNPSVYRQVAALHAENINKGFLSSLGIPFLSLLYRAIDENERSVLLISETDEGVVGFVSASEGMVSVYWQLLRHFPTLVVSLLPALLSLSKLKKIFDLLFVKRTNQVDNSNFPNAELLSIAVDSLYRRHNIAKDLYRRLCKYFQNRDIQEFYIVVGEQLSEAHNFYRNMGADPIGRVIVHSGEESVVYRQVIGIEEPDSRIKIV